MLLFRMRKFYKILSFFQLLVDPKSRKCHYWHERKWRYLVKQLSSFFFFLHISICFLFLYNIRKSIYFCEFVRGNCFYDFIFFSFYSIPAINFIHALNVKKLFQGTVITKFSITMNIFCRKMSFSRISLLFY